MSYASVLLNPLFPRAVVIGGFGAVGLALTVIYSRRGPLILPVYAAVLGALALPLARYAELPYATRVIAALAGFGVASAGLYVASYRMAELNRRQLVAEDRLPESALSARISVAGHAWRIGFLLVGRHVGERGRRLR